MTRSRARLLLSGSIAVLVAGAGLYFYGQGRPLNDTLVLRDEIRTGALASCDESSCTFDGAVVSRLVIRAIGLRAKLPVPGSENPPIDELYLVDGTIHVARLLAIDALEVATATDRFPRQDVVWIRLARGSPASPPDAAPAAPTTPTAPDFLWVGTVRVENRYTDERYGRHHWKALYRLELVEQNSKDTFPSPLGRPTANHPFKPLEFAYEFDADQNRRLWLRDDFSVTLVMRGKAKGALTGEGLTAFNGNVWGLYETLEPLAAQVTFASEREADNYKVDVQNEPGWYSFTLDLPGEYAERRAYYKGIELSGTKWEYNEITDQSYLASIPPCMPTPTTVRGRLDRPDQSQVTGRISYPFRSGADTTETPHLISIEWSFSRTPRQPATSGASAK